MNIKQTLTIRFILVFTMIWVIGSAIIYWSSANFRREEFYQRLHSRANTSAKLLIEVEEVDAQLLKKIESANPIKLPGERITIYDYNSVELFSTDADDSIHVTEDRFNEIRLDGEVSWKQGEIEVLGLLYADQYDRYVVVASGQDIYGYRKLEYLRNILMFVFVISVIVIAFSARIYAGKALEPIAQVIEEVNTIGISNLSQRVSEGNGRDEIAILGITFNRMLGRLQATFESQKSFIANASHELRTPMTSILSQVDVVLLKDRASAEYIQTLNSIKEDIRELAILSDRLLLLARIDAFKESFVVVRIDSMLWQAISDVSKTFKNQVVVDISPLIDDERFLTIHGSEQLIKSAMLNVLENACKYSEEEVRVNLAIEEDELVVSVMDRGIGILADDLSRVTDPFFRGSNTQGFAGSGIGLNLVKKIMDIHEGTYSIHSIADSGTTVRMGFPYMRF